MRKRAHARGTTHRGTRSTKKETFETVAAEPVLAESSVAVFEAPIDFAEAEQESPEDTIEVYEITFVRDENES